MKRISTCFICLFLFSSQIQLQAEELYNCVVPSELGGSDGFNRGFLISAFPGFTLDKVYLFFEVATPGAATYSLTVRDSTFGGDLLGVAEASYDFSIADLPVPIVFDFRQLAIQQGTRVTFVIEQLTGDISTFYSTAGASAGCPVLETDTINPLVGISIRGAVHAIVLGDAEEPTASMALLENPPDAAGVSGVTSISGWVCDATRVEVEIDGATRVEAAYGTPRADTMDVCGDIDNGFGLLVNLGIFGDGEHTIRLLADDIEVDSGTFTVTTLGGPFVSGLSGTFDLADFPEAGQQVTIEWLQSLQGFVIIDFVE